jgi:hypothetical protein
MGLEKWKQHRGSIPSHCVQSIVWIVRQNSESWLEFAEQLDTRGDVGGCGFGSWPLLLRISSSGCILQDELFGVSVTGTTKQTYVLKFHFWEERRLRNVGANVPNATSST